MAGSRPLSRIETRSLIRRLRFLNARDRALITAQLFTGYRISEVLSLTIGQVFREERVPDRIGVRPAYLKGNYGTTRWVPVCQELRRALEAYLDRRSIKGPLRATDPLFLSREHDGAGQPKALSRSAAEKLIRRILRTAATSDDQQLSSHSLRKSWASRLYEASGHDLMLVRDGLGHSSVSVTQAYLSVDRARLEKLIVANDWTKRPRKPKVATPIVVAAAIPAPTEPSPSQSLCLPGFEALVA